MRLRVYIPGNRARERLVVFLGPLLQTFNQICPRNMKMKRFLLKKLLIYKNELKMQVTVINSWAVHLSGLYCKIWTAASEFFLFHSAPVHVRIYLRDKRL